MIILELEMKLGVELLPNMCEALSLISGARKKYYLKSKKGYWH